MRDNTVAAYRQKADECRLQAEQSIRDEDKAQWLRLAEAWQNLAENAEQFVEGISLRLARDNDALGLKAPRDMNQWASAGSILLLAAGETKPGPANEGKDSAGVSRGPLGGKKSGAARAAAFRLSSVGVGVEASA